MPTSGTAVAVAIATADGDSGRAGGSRGGSPNAPHGSGWLVLMHRPSRQGIGGKHAVHSHGFRLGGPDDDFVLWRHAGTVAEIFSVNQGAWQLTATSTTPVFANGAPVVGTAQLQSNDELEMLDHYFVFLANDPIDSAYHELIYRLTIQDIPSRLANKRFLTEIIVREGARAARRSSPLAVASLSLSCEHASPTVIDHQIRSLGRALQKALGRSAAIGRVDAQEIAIVVPDQPSLDLSRMVAEVFAEHQAAQLDLPPLRARVGVVEYRDGLTAVEMLARAASRAQ